MGIRSWSFLRISALEQFLYFGRWQTSNGVTMCLGERRYTLKFFNCLNCCLSFSLKAPCFYLSTAWLAVLSFSFASFLLEPSFEPWDTVAEALERGLSVSPSVSLIVPSISQFDYYWRMLGPLWRPWGYSVLFIWSVLFNWFLCDVGVKFCSFEIGESVF